MTLDFNFKFYVNPIFGPKTFDQIFYWTVHIIITCQYLVAILKSTKLNNGVKLPLYSYMVKKVLNLFCVRQENTVLGHQLRSNNTMIGYYKV